MHAAEHDAGTSLRVAALHKRNQNLVEVMEALSDVLFIQQKAAEAEYVSLPQRLQRTPMSPLTEGITSNQL